MAVLNNQIFPLLDKVVEAYREKVSSQSISAQLENIQLCNTPSDYAWAIASYIEGHILNRGEILQILYKSYGILNSEFQYRCGNQLGNTTVLIALHKGDGTALALGISTRMNAIEVIKGTTYHEWSRKFFERCN